MADGVRTVEDAEAALARAAGERAERRDRTRQRRLIALAFAVVVGLLAGTGLLLLGTVLRSYRIPSLAMEPTIPHGAHVLTRAIDGSEVHRRDIVLYRSPSSDATLLIPDVSRISRVEALAGDRVAARDGHLVVDGHVVDEPGFAPTPDFGPIRVPKGHVFLVGDNRLNSADSRVEGPLPTAQVQRLVVVRDAPGFLATLLVVLVGGAGVAVVVLGFRLARDADRRAS